MFQIFFLLNSAAVNCTHGPSLLTPLFCWLLYYGVELLLASKFSSLGEERSALEAHFARMLQPNSVWHQPGSLFVLSGLWIFCSLYGKQQHQMLTYLIAAASHSPSPNLPVNYSSLRNLVQLWNILFHWFNVGWVQFFYCAVRIHIFKCISGQCIMYDYVKKMLA